MARLTYRPEIDGLRAIAVLAVVFFHSQLKFPGGYVGVDVFFVVSGYLITSLIAADLAAGEFSLRLFWERRIRRIFPAATVTVLVTLLLGFALMLPADFAQLGRSAVAQALVAANFFFWQETGYFSTPAESQPLLHFWSLAVEEQFYVVFPLVLLGLWRWWSLATVPTLAIIAVGSFVLSLVGVARFPDATFYLLPTRAWELAVGALLALRGGPGPIPDRARGWCGWVGLGMIVAPMFVYTHETPFPGLAAVPPCLGTLLLIWSTGRGDSLLKRLLSLRPVVMIGLLSYSLYLWHWPVKVFTHYWFTGQYSPLAMRLLVLPVSLVLAWFSWKYVELPFRAKRPRRSSALWAAVALSGSVAVALLGVWVVRQDGLPSRFSEEVMKFAAAYDDRPKAEEADLTVEAAERGALARLSQRPIHAASILLWGDSHARVVSPAVEEMCRQMGIQGYRASRSETPSLLERGDEETRRYSAAILRWIVDHRPTVVLMVSRWDRALQSEEDGDELKRTVRAVESLGVKVVLMRQVALHPGDIPKLLARASLLGGEVDRVGVPVETHSMATRRSNDTISRVASAVPGLLVIDPIPYLSRDGRCLAEHQGRPLYYDRQHLTRFGASFLTPMFTSAMRAAVPPMAGLRKCGAVDLHEPFYRCHEGAPYSSNRNFHPRGATSVRFPTSNSQVSSPIDDCRPSPSTSWM